MIRLQIANNETINCDSMELLFCIQCRSLLITQRKSQSFDRWLKLPWCCWREVFKFVRFLPFSSLFFCRTRRRHIRMPTVCLDCVSPPFISHSRAQHSSAECYQGEISTGRSRFNLPKALKLSRIASSSREEWKKRRMENMEEFEWLGKQSNNREFCDIIVVLRW